MDTKIIKIADPENPKDKELAEAAEIIRAGGLVAFPTETVYGLGADMLNGEAAKKIYAAKGRPSDNPLIAHIFRIEELETLAREIPGAAWEIAGRFWPGPFTMVLKKKEIVPESSTGGLDTVAVRMPGNAVANRLIELAGVPIAAPSANVSGRPSPTAAAHVIKDLYGKIDMVIDGGPSDIGLESTIVDFTGEIPVLLRPGAVTYEMLTDALGEVGVDPAVNGPVSGGVKPKAPGMKYRHYAPRAEMTLVEGEAGRVASYIAREARSFVIGGGRAGIICSEENSGLYPRDENIFIIVTGSRGNVGTIARNLYAALRDMDDKNVSHIYAEGVPEGDIGRAVMNRLCKAAGYHIARV